MSSADSPGKRYYDGYEEIRRVYIDFPHPWVVGYSGGKDSTTTLQMIWYALAELPPEQRQKPVYVISTNTLVETPIMIDYIDEMMLKNASRHESSFARR